MRDNTIAAVAALMQQLIDERDEARRQVTDMAAKVLLLDGELIDAHGRIETLELQLAAATAELDTWASTAGTVGPVGMPD